MFIYVTVRPGDCEPHVNLFSLNFHNSTLSDKSATQAALYCLADSSNLFT